MRILALDSSTAVGGVAALQDGNLVGEITLQVSATHAERLMPAVSSVMEEAGWLGKIPDVVAVAVGPGSFTGVRIAVATAKSLAYGWNSALVGVSTLEALAWQACWHSGLICPLIDARRGQAYYQLFRCDQNSKRRLEAQSKPDIRRVAEIAADLPDEPVVFVGDGAMVNWKDISGVMGARALLPPSGLGVLRAASVGTLGMYHYSARNLSDPLTLTPMYLRRSEAEIRLEKRKTQS